MGGDRNACAGLHRCSFHAICRLPRVHKELYERANPKAPITTALFHHDDFFGFSLCDGGLLN